MLGKTVTLNWVYFLHLLQIQVTVITDIQLQKRTMLVSGRNYQSSDETVTITNYNVIFDTQKTQTFAASWFTRIKCLSIACRGVPVVQKFTGIALN